MQDNTLAMENEGVMLAYTKSLPGWDRCRVRPVAPILDFLQRQKGSRAVHPVQQQPDNSESG